MVFDGSGNVNWVTLPQLDPKSTPTIPEFFRGCDLFITGGSGFMGRILVEKLLRSCPDIGNIYLLLRVKKGVDQKERLKSLLNVPLFDVLRERYPDAISKVKIICGDARHVGLGISEEDRVLLQNKISIVMHAAASVRFDESLKQSILLNTQSALEIAKLAEGMTKLKVLLHISTMYCNIDQGIVEERIYPPRTDWRVLLKWAQNRDDDILSILEQKILKDFPNTYTFSKCLAEDILYEYRTKLPIVIFRPSIVVPTYKEPLPGWVDNFNGPMATLLGVKTGLLHIVYADSNVAPDWLPADVANNSLLISTWYRAVSPNLQNKCLVINAATSNARPQDGQTLCLNPNFCGIKNPFNRMLWYPFVFITTNHILFLIGTILFHLLPGMFLDVLIKMKGIKLSLMRLYRKIYFTNLKLSHFTLQEFKFVTKRFESILTVVLKPDKEEFKVNVFDIELYKFYDNITYGYTKYLLKEEINEPQAYRNLQRMFWLHFTVCTLLSIGATYMCWSYHKIVTEPLVNISPIFV